MTAALAPGIRLECTECRLALLSIEGDATGPIVETQLCQIDDALPALLGQAPCPLFVSWSQPVPPPSRQCSKGAGVGGCSTGGCASGAGGGCGSGAGCGSCGLKDLLAGRLPGAARQAIAA